MSEIQDRWLWVIDEKLLAALSGSPTPTSAEEPNPPLGAEIVQLLAEVPNQEAQVAFVEAEPVEEAAEPEIEVALDLPDPPVAENVVDDRSIVLPLPSDQPPRSWNPEVQATPFLISHQLPILPRQTVAIDMTWDEARNKFHSGQFDDALRLFRELLRKEPTNPAAVHNISVCLQQLGRYQEATQSFEQTLELLPNDNEAKTGLAWCLLELQNADEALKIFDEQLASSPEDQDALRGKAQALQLLSRTDDAKKVYETLLAEDPANSEVLTNLIAIAAEQKDIAALWLHGEALLSIDPNSESALAAVATANLREGAHQDALTHLTLFLDAEPHSYAGWYNFGLASQQSGLLDQAERGYREAMYIDGMRIEPPMSLGYLQLSRKEIGEAQQQFEKILSMQAGNATALWNLGLIQESQERFCEAEGSFTELLALEPQRLSAMFHLAYVRLRSSDLAGSAELFSKCVAQRRDWVEAWFYLGLTNWLLGDTGAASQDLDTALQVDPIYIPALQCRAALALAVGDLTVAPELEAQLADLGKTTPEFCYNLGILQDEAHQQDAAIHSFRRAIGKRPTFGDALLNLGCTLDKAGRRDDAVEIWQNALLSKPELAEDYFRLEANA